MAILMLQKLCVYTLYITIYISFYIILYHYISLLYIIIIYHDS